MPVDGVGEAIVTKPVREGGKGRDPLDRDPFGLDKAVISVPLLEKLKDEQRKKGPDAAAPVPVIIDLNLMFPGGRQAARRRVLAMVTTVVDGKTGQAVNRAKTRTSTQYVYALLDGESITELVKEDGKGESHAIYRIWPDFVVKALINKSISTVKADAAREVVLGARERHLLGGHRFRHRPGPRALRDAREPGAAAGPASPGLHRRRRRAPRRSPTPSATAPTSPASSPAGCASGGQGADPRASTAGASRARGARPSARPSTTISGHGARVQAPVSLRVLDDDGEGLASSFIAALEYVQEINGNGRRLRVHGVNLSVGYEFEPEWFACGQSPLCVEVDRLVRSGVVVVVAAGNTGYGWTSRHRDGERSRRRHGPHDQRSRQRRAGDHRRLHAPRHAARLRRLLLLVEGARPAMGA